MGTIPDDDEREEPFFWLALKALAGTVLLVFVLAFAALAAAVGACGAWIRRGLKRAD